SLPIYSKLSDNRKIFNLSRYWRDSKMLIGISSALAASFMMFVDGGLAAGQEYEAVAVLSGIAKVRDGDGVLFGDVQVRLQGIAAPEDSPANREPGGPEST